MATDMLMVAKYFERIGITSATNIAEWVIYSSPENTKTNKFKKLFLTDIKKV